MFVVDIMVGIDQNWWEKIRRPPQSGQCPFELLVYFPWGKFQREENHLGCKWKKWVQPSGPIWVTTHMHRYTDLFTVQPENIFPIFLHNNGFFVWWCPSEPGNKPGHLLNLFVHFTPTLKWMSVRRQRNNVKRALVINVLLHFIVCAIDCGPMCNVHI